MKLPFLDRRLVLEEARLTPDGAGGYSESWEELGVLWGEIKPRTGRARADEFVTVSSTGFRITVRASAPGAPSRPRAGQRFRAGSRVFLILAVTEADANPAYLVCYAQEEVSV